MGGFVFDNSRNSDTLPFPDGKEQVAIDRKLLVWLAENEPDMIPDISPGHITDKSKANHLAKFLVCVQAGWFGAQVISRLSMGLAVTLLELNVFAHVVCTLLTYACWWEKPLDIDEPTSVYTDDPKAGSLWAAFWSRMNLRLSTILVVRREGQSTTEPMLTVEGFPIAVDQMVLSPRRAQELWSHCFDGRTVASQQGSRYFSKQEYPSEEVLLFLFPNYTPESLDDDNTEHRIFIELDSALVNKKLSPIKLRTGASGPNDRVYAAFKGYDLQYHLCAHSHPAGLKALMVYSPSFKFKEMRSRISNWSNAKLGVERINIDLLLFIGASVLYSAWHLTAWNGPFRTAAEGMLWKVSAVSVAGVPIVVTAVFLLFCSISPANDRVITWLDRWISPLILALTPLSCCLLIFFRTFLVVESFISLAFVPDTVFSVPQWSIYFPHIG